MATLKINLDGTVTEYTLTAAADENALTFISGTDGRDVLVSTPQAVENTFAGGLGDDISFATTADDIFVFNSGDGHDRIVGFDIAEDRLDFASFGIEGDIGEFLESNAMDTANGTLITLDPATTVLVQGVLKANIDASHIVTGYA
jgi:hypothetical protein